jgi:hypothetical protein
MHIKNNIKLKTQHFINDLEDMVYGIFHGNYKTFLDVPENEDTMAFGNIFNKLSCIISNTDDFNKLNNETYNYMIYIGLNNFINNSIINLYNNIYKTIAINTYKWILKYYIQCPICKCENKHPQTYVFNCFNCKSILSI